MFRRVPFVLLVVLGLLVVPATVAAAQPSLQATVIPGQEIDVVGSGFPASTDVSLLIQRSNHPDQTRALQTDASGGFTTTIDAGPGLGGAYTLVATAGSSTASADVVAVETAGGTLGGAQTPPPTDTLAPAPAERPSGLPLIAVLGLLLAGVVGAGWSIRRVRIAAN